MPRGGPNQKAVAAKEKKAANQAIKDAEKARQAEAAAAKSWSEGANLRGASKAEAAAAKADEAARKKREKVRDDCMCMHIYEFHHTLRLTNIITLLLRDVFIYDGRLPF